MEEFIEIVRGIWYEKSTGLPWTSKKSGGSSGFKYDAPMKRLSNKSKTGYYLVRLNGKTVSWHRIVYEFFCGPIPRDKEVDHKNNKRDDNRIENLQLLSAIENNRYHLKYKNNQSGYPGVCWYKKRKKWVAHITINGILKHLGYFDHPEDAYKVYIAAKIKHHGRESVRHLRLT